MPSSVELSPAAQHLLDAAALLSDHDVVVRKHYDVKGLVVAETEVRASGYRSGVAPSPEAALVALLVALTRSA